jgi:hypothetical protein
VAVHRANFGGVVEVVVEGSLQLLLGIFLRIMGQTTFIITFSHVWVFLILITQFLQPIGACLLTLFLILSISF